MLQVGLIVGHASATRDFIFFLVKTPAQVRQDILSPSVPGVSCRQPCNMRNDTPQSSCLYRTVSKLLMSDKRPLLRRQRSQQKARQRTAAMSLLMLSGLERTPAKWRRCCPAVSPHHSTFHNRKGQHHSTCLCFTPHTRGSSSRHVHAVAGVTVLGFYLLATTAGFQGAVAALTRLAQALPSPATDGAKASEAATGPLLLHIDAVTGKCAAKVVSFEPGATAAPRPAELSFGPALSNFQALATQFRLDADVPIPKVQATGSSRSVLHLNLGDKFVMSRTALSFPIALQKSSAAGRYSFTGAA